MGLTYPAPAITHLRCGTPDCDWGTPIGPAGPEQWERCYEAFRVHCIEWHGLDSDDTEPRFWFDLEVGTLTLLDGTSTGLAGKRCPKTYSH